ncbi:MAG: response regulator transcription factor, partial [Deltaproteobacteria bacterium]
MTTKTRLLIVEDHAILRDGLRSVLVDYPEFVIVGEAEDGFEAVQQCENCGPDLVLLDLSLPKQDGIVTLRKIKNKWPETAVLVLTMHRSKQSLDEAMEAGADGYCLKDSPMDELVRALRAVIQGRQYISKEMLCFCEERSRTRARGLVGGEENAKAVSL